MGYRPYDPHAPLLFGYDPVRDLPADHLARFVDQVVEQTVAVPDLPRRQGHPGYDPRVCIKVLVYGYATGVRSSRQLAQNCQENLAYRFLVGDCVPCFRTLCTARLEQKELLEAVWVGLFAVAAAEGRGRIGKLVVDTSKFRANASGESVLKAAELAPVLAELERIVAEADRVDAQEAKEGHPGQTRLGDAPKKVQMRDILRRVRAQLAKQRRAAEEAAAASARGEQPAPEPPEEAGEERPGFSAAEMTPRMRKRVRELAKVLEEAIEEGRKFVSTTDAEAQMMAGGSDHKIQECHSLEGAVDKGCGLLVAATTTQEGTDNGRLEALVAEAEKQEPVRITEVDGDSGFFTSEAILSLEKAGISTCIPNTGTACDLHRGQPVGTTLSRSGGGVALVYDPDEDCFRCSQGMVLVFDRVKREGEQEARVYRAQGDCASCPLAGKCLHNKKAKQRTVRVWQLGSQIKEILQRFDEPAHRERYHHRGAFIETVWGFLRGTLGYNRWLLRGKEGVAAEGRLFKLAYQIRKVHSLREAEATAV